MDIGPVGWHKEFTMWTDGSAKETGHSGCSFVWRAGRDLFGAYDSLGKLSNGTESFRPAEVYGILAAIRFFRNNCLGYSAAVRPGKLTIISDCLAVLRRIEDVRADHVEYRGTGVDDIVYVIENLERDFGIQVKLVWKPRCSTIEMIRADRWAKDASTLAIQYPHEERRVEIFSKSS